MQDGELIERSHPLTLTHSHSLLFSLPLTLPRVRDSLTYDEDAVHEEKTFALGGRQVAQKEAPVGELEEEVLGRRPHLAGEDGSCPRDILRVYG